MVSGPVNNAISASASMLSLVKVVMVAVLLSTLTISTIALGLSQTRGIIQISEIGRYSRTVGTVDVFNSKTGELSSRPT